MARPSTLAKVDGLKEFVAELYVTGVTIEAMRTAVVEKFPEVDLPGEKTIRRWREDPQVKEITQRLTRERAVRVARMTDEELARRLAKPKELSVKELIEIRREFVPDLKGMGEDTADPRKTAEDIFGAMAEDPDFAASVKEAADRAAAVGDE